MPPDDAPAQDTAAAQKKAAHVLWVALHTRIATQRLPFRSGDEEAANSSLYDIFKKTRDLMEQSPGATDFLEVADRMLNDTLRDSMARWHGWMTADATVRDKDGKPTLRFRDDWVRKQFRRELRALQPHLVGFALAFEALKDGTPKADIPDWWTAKSKTEAQLAELRARCREPMEAVLGQSLPAGIDPGRLRIKGKTLEQQADLIGRINAAEHGEIRGRHGRSPDGPVVDARGLAFSGGGIRSATFCLGISQVLVRRGLFSQFDYMSTVSGGGYIGSFFSATLGTGECDEVSEERETAARLNTVLDAPPLPDAAPRHSHETTPIRHLRNHSRYLTEGGFYRQLLGVGMVLAGMVFNLLILLLLPLGLALFTYLLDEQGYFHIKEWATNPDHWLPVYGAWGKGVLVILSITALAGLAYPRIKSRAESVRYREEKSRLLKLWEKCFFGAAIVSGVVVIASLLPLGFRLYGYLLSGQLLTSLLGIKAKLDGIAATCGVTVTIVLATLASKVNPTGSAGKWLRILALICVPALCLFAYFAVGHRMLIASGADHWPWPCVTGVTLAILIWARWCLDVNTYSPHGYYRDRLSDCYMRAIKRVSVSESAPDGIVMEHVDGLRLSKLNQRAAAPYHLINTTLNVPNSTEREVRGRNADFFLFSKHFCGSTLTGFHPTAELEAADGHLNLGTALAVSGAAAGSNMGWQTDNMLRILMTLGNVRLGYWLRNPVLGAQKAKDLGRPSAPYLLREMFALKMDESQPFVNLSDGGHHENLAVYELLRRRCKFIVAIDGGCEPDMQCTDLLRLERYAAIDFGIRMHYDLTDLYLQTVGSSRAYGVLVKIDYNPPASDTVRRTRRPEDAEWGWMLYIKLATVGYGPGYVMEYKRTHGAFPHESTGDQIYDEAQFEAYRALGEAAAESFFVPEIEEVIKDTERGTLQGWFRALAVTLLPDNNEALKRTV